MRNVQCNTDNGRRMTGATSDGDSGVGRGLQRCAESGEGGDDGGFTAVFSRRTTRVLARENERLERVRGGGEQVFRVVLWRRVQEMQGDTLTEVVTQFEQGGLMRICSEIRARIPGSTVSFSRGNLIVGVNSLEHARSLVVASDIAGVAIAGQCKELMEYWGVIRDVDTYFTDAEVLEELKSHGVVAVR